MHLESRVARLPCGRTVSSTPSCCRHFARMCFLCLLWVERKQTCVTPPPSNEREKQARACCNALGSELARRIVKRGNAEMRRAPLSSCTIIWIRIRFLRVSNRRLMLRGAENRSSGDEAGPIWSERCSLTPTVHASIVSPPSDVESSQFARDGPHEGVDHRPADARDVRGHHSTSRDPSGLDRFNEEVATIDALANDS